jgi:VWFA-related protein
MNHFISSLLVFALINTANAQNELPQEQLTPRVDAIKGSEVRINQIDTSAFPKVTIFATVLKEGMPVEGLVSNDFRVREDEVDQEPLSVQAQLSALNAVVTIDTSGSIKKALPQVQAAASNFLDSLNASDKFDVISFSREVKTISTDGNKEQAKQAISQTMARGDTALFDAIYQSIAALKDRSGRKSVILLTDGVDDDGSGKQLSKHSLDEALALAKTINVPVFTIGLGPEKDVTNLEKIANGTGGKYFDAANPEQLAGIYKQIGKEITGQYNIYYTSNIPADGSIHRVNLAYSGIQGIKEYESPITTTIVNKEATAVVPTKTETVVATNETVIAKTSKVISTKAGLHVAVTLSEGSDSVPFNKIVVANKPASAFEQPKKVADCSYEKSHCSFVVPTGSYTVTATKGDAEASINVDVKADIANNAWVNLNAGMISLVAIPADGASRTEINKVTFNSKPASAFDKSIEVATCYSTELCEVFIPAGNYVIQVKKGEAIATQDLVVEAGKKQEVQMNLKAGILNVMASLNQNGAPVKMTKVEITKPAENAFGNETTITSCYSEEKCSFVLNAAKYNIKVKFGDATAMEQVEIGVGQKLDKALILNAGVVKIAVFDEKGTAAKIKKANVTRASNNNVDGPENIGSCYSENICEFKLPSGKYNVKAEYGEAEKTAEFEVTAGQVLNLEIR